MAPVAERKETTLCLVFKLPHGAGSSQSAPTHPSPATEAETRFLLDALALPHLQAFPSQPGVPLHPSVSSSAFEAQLKCPSPKSLGWISQYDLNIPPFVYDLYVYHNFDPACVTAFCFNVLSPLLMAQTICNLSCVPSTYPRIWLSTIPHGC